MIHMILFIRKKNIIQSIFFTILMSIRAAYYINNYISIFGNNSVWHNIFLLRFIKGFCI